MRAQRGCFPSSRKAAGQPDRTPNLAFGRANAGIPCPGWCGSYLQGIVRKGARVVELFDLIFPVMLYPDDVEARVRDYRAALPLGASVTGDELVRRDPMGHRDLALAYDALRRFAGRQQTPMTDFQSRLECGNLSAMVLLYLLEMHRAGRVPSVSRAVDVAIRECGETKIRDAWGAFKPASPLWAGLIVAAMEHDNPALIPRTPPELALFATRSKGYFDAAMQLPSRVEFEKSVRAFSGFDLLAFYLNLPGRPGQIPEGIIQQQDVTRLVKPNQRPGRKPQTQNEK